MATAQLHRTQGKTWESIFPNEQVTEQKSALFVKKLLAVAISNITYLRAIFPEHAYGDKSLEDLNLKVLRDESSCPGACQVIKWVKGCFDALDKKYLSFFYQIYVDPKNPESVIESYTFKFTYHNHGEIDIYRNDKKVSSAYSSEETKKATIRLLRTLIILTNTLTSLPDNVMMTMKLFYYDEVTPADYEPPGFRPSNDFTFHFAEEATNIAIGEVATPFHMVKMRIKTGSKQFEFHDEQVEEMEHSEQILAISNAGLDNENNPVQEITSDKVKSMSTVENELPGNNSSKKKLSPTQPDALKSPGRPEPDEDFLVRCPCGCNEDDGLMVMCSACKFWQHGICFLIKSEHKAPADHICDLCAQAGNSKLQPTDPYLCGLSVVERQGTCLWRRTLSACLEYKRLMAPQLARRLGIDNNVAQGLINRLEKEKYISATGSSQKRMGKTIDHEKIKNDGIPRYLSTPSSASQNTLHHSEMKDNLMDTNITSNQTSLKENGPEKDISTLSDKTSKLNLQHSKRITRSNRSETESHQFPAPDLKVKKGRKRAYSKINSNEFDISDSQESLTVAKKKASTVTKDIAV
ncbi:HORMA domain-containing protein 1 [Bulinus truncatus]|nr:HORMA domain-containing protein 1 [Bulinus truncatus]